MANILITGGSGFIGASLCNALIADGHNVRAYDIKSAPHPAHGDGTLTFVEASITDKDALSDAFSGVDVCFHLAGAPTDHDIRKHGVEMGVGLSEVSKALFSIAHEAGNVPVVYASSAAVYGIQPPGPIAETASLRPINAHGEEKMLLEVAAKMAFADHGVPSIGLRFFNLYGPTQSPQSVYCGAPRRFVECLLNDKPIPLNGEGLQLRDFTYIDDAVQALKTAMTNIKDSADIFNICTGVGYNIRDLAQLIASAAKKELTFVHHAQSSATDVQSSIGDPRKAKSEFGFEARISLPEGILKMVDELF